MAASILGSINFGQTVKNAEKQSPIRALPAIWYTSPEMYQVEKEAIFTRRWLLITHSLRLRSVGDWLRYDVVNVDFVLYRADDGEIHGARDVTDMEQISDNHGHNTRVHIHIDYNGFIWVNLDENDEPEVCWDDLFEGIDRQDRYQGLDFDDYIFDHTWQMEGQYNWKMASDNYNECYHCSTTHPDLVDLTNLEAYAVEVDRGWVKHFVGTKPEQEAKGLRVHPTYFYPSTSMNVSRNFFMLQRFVPRGPLHSIMYYEVYRHKTSSARDFQVINDVYHRVMAEDKLLCQLAQNNVNRGLFVNGEMHPRLEAGPLHIQKLCREDVVEFLDKRRRTQNNRARRDSWPIPQVVRDLSSYALDAIRPSLQYTPLRMLVAA